MINKIVNKTLLLCAFVSLTVSCKSKPEPEKEPLATSSAAPLVVSASASAALVPNKPPKDAIPTLVPDAPIEATKGMDFYAITGAFIVEDGLRIGRLVDDKVEWIGTLPDLNQGLGGSYIRGVTGVWPDVEVHYTSQNGRAEQPSVYPLGGEKGKNVRFAEGGGLGWVRGVVRVGKTTLVAGSDMYSGARFETLRGPGLKIKPITAEKFGCKPGEVRQQGEEDPIALQFSAVGVTEKGTLVTVGDLCDDRKRPAAEIWDDVSTSRIVELGDIIKEFDYFPNVVRGKGDELFIGSKRGILRYRDGKFDALPVPTIPPQNLFVSPQGKLHGVANQDLVRFDDGKWTTIAKVPRSLSSGTITMDEKGTIWVAHGGVAKLREAEGNEGEPPCKTPFVYLYDVSWKNENNYTFPTTRKALSTFPDVGKIKLVEYKDYYGRRLGAQVESEEQAKALIEHVKANMKDEYPELICYEPTAPRVIEMKGK